MRTLEALRRRITTIEDLRSIVRTMKSLSAVSIRQYERAAASLVDYERTVELGLQAVLASAHLPRTRPRHAPDRAAAIVFGSDHGLCGRFNDDLGRFVEEGPRVERFLAVGARAAARLEALGERIESVLSLPGSAAGLTSTTQSILVTIDAWRDTGGASRVLLVHNRRSDVSTAKPMRVQLLPLDPERFRRLAASRWPSNEVPMLSGDPDRLLRSLLRQYFFVLVFRAGAESLASEHATRLAALEAAERHIDDHLGEANAEYRRRRQESITEELLDVVSGFEALRDVEGDAP